VKEPRRKSTRVLIIGVDSLDAGVLNDLGGSLPNISALARSGTQLPVRSTFPPDSDTAWATIYTGTNPAQHGIVKFVDPLEKSHQIQNIATANDAIAGRTFWDIAARQGRRSVVLFPHLGYPIWRPQDVVIARDARTGASEAQPSHLVDAYPCPDLLSGVPGFPGRGVKGLRTHLRRLEQLAENDSAFALKVMQHERWDLFFAYFSTVDAVSHFFWGDGDPSRHSHAPKHPLSDAVRRTYELYDRIIGRILAEVDPETSVILLSDHGHGPRPRTLLHVNEILRRHGLLVSRQSAARPQVRLQQSALRTLVRIVSRYNLGRPAGLGLRAFPSLMRFFTRPGSIDWSKTVAYASDMSGIKSYSYGGVIVNRDLAQGGDDYENIRDRIIAALRADCQVDGRSVLKHVTRREDVYRGPHIGKYPDILLELDAGYGLGWAVDTPLVTTAPSHNLVPGSHRGDGATFIFRSPRQLKPEHSTVDLVDIAPTVLDALGCLEGSPDYFEGASLLTPELQ